MSFAQPGWLLLSLLSFVVILLHIRRRKVINVSSLELFKKLALSQKPNRAWRWPKPSWLLFLQLLAVILISLALARPELGTPFKLDHWLVILDASGSMLAKDGLEGPSRFDLAISSLKEQLKSFDNSQQLFSLIRLGAEVEVLGARLQDAQVMSLLGEVQAEAVQVGKSAWQEALSLAKSLKSADEFLHVTVLSDGAGAQVASELLAAWPELSQQVLSFGGALDNLGLADVKLTALNLAKHEWQLEGTVKAFGSSLKDKSLSLFFRPEGTQGFLAWGTLALSFKPLAEGGEAAVFASKLSLPAAGLLELRLPEDGLAWDNQRFVELKEAPKALRVLEVGPGNEALERVFLAVEGLELFKSPTLPPEQNYDLIILDRVKVAQKPQTNTLWLGGASLSTASEPLSLDEVNLTAWQTQHPLSAGIDWSTLKLTKALAIPLLAGASSLVEASGHPLIQARSTGVGREVILAFDLSQSPWTESLGFPIFMANLLRWLSPWQDALAPPALGRSCGVALVCDMRPQELYGGLALIPELAESSLAPLPSPFAPNAATPASEAWLPSATSAFYPKATGLYRLANGELLSIYAPASPESDLRQAAVALKPIQLGDGAWPMFRYLLLGLLLVLLAEMWLAGRGADRFLLRASLDAKNPLARRHWRVLILRLLTLVCCLLALLGFSLMQPQRKAKTVVILDDALDNESQTRLGSLLTPLKPSSNFIRFYPLADQPLETREAEFSAPNLSAALKMASGLLADAPESHITLVTNDVKGDLWAGLRGLDHPIDLLPLGGLAQAEVMVGPLSVASQLYQGDPFVLQGSFYSAQGGEALLRVWRDGELYHEENLELLRGYQPFQMSFRETSAQKVFYEYELIVSQDGQSLNNLNNRSGLVVAFKPKARVLIITQQPAWASVLAEALALQGIEADMVEPVDAPYGLKDLLGYDGVILANVPAIALHSVQQELLERWVHDYGGGMLILGESIVLGRGAIIRRGSSASPPSPAASPKKLLKSP
ncbi:MAG: BatA and WFA domain-containing protein [Deinococcales bacterium]